MSYVLTKCLSEKKMYTIRIFHAKKNDIVPGLGYKL